MKWGTINEPKKVGRYLVTIKTSLGNQIRIADRVKSHIDTLEWYILGNTGYSHDVIAWIKCPKPYEVLR